jgi:tRNA(fMet)-specific endonuclease VapC
LLEIITPLPFDVRAALRFAEIPFHRGRSDRLIAAHTLALGLILVTNNEKDFADVAGLMIENWTRP